VTARGGAYGLSLVGVDDARELLVEAPADWPELELSSAPGGGRPPRQWVRPGDARIALQGGGRVDVDWARGRAVFRVPRGLTAAELVHPYLAPVAGLAAHRAGRESFHAGAMVAGEGAWVLLGDKGAGKSSLLASLALAGHPVMADDVVVVDEAERVLAGPRSVDLRADAARRLGVGELLGTVGARTRHRMVVGAVPPSVPLEGFVVLAWAEDAATALERVAPSARLTELARARVANIAPTDPAPLMRLASLPMFEFRRPRDWALAAETAQTLATRLG
jgi:hypothetical protein